MISPIFLTSKFYKKTNHLRHVKYSLQNFHYEVYHLYLTIIEYHNSSYLFKMQIAWCVLTKCMLLYSSLLSSKGDYNKLLFWKGFRPIREHVYSVRKTFRFRKKNTFQPLKYVMTWLIYSAGISISTPFFSFKVE